MLLRGMDELGKNALGRSLAAKVNIVASPAKDVSPLGFWVLLVLIACCWFLLCSRFGFAPVVRRREFGAHGESEVREMNRTRESGDKEKKYLHQYT